ncbi:MAG: HAMP domain-containing histidine kinase [Desulfovibrio sp.]|nr:HAMP domain-containing histidine kinase [Desulfovibrio sp.]
MQGSEPAKTAQAPGASADEAVDEAERGLSLSFARTLSWLSLVVVLLTSLGLSFFISNSARQTLMHRQENFITVLTQNLNNQIFQRFAVPTIVAYGRISLREAPQYERLDKVVKSVIEGLPVTRLRLYDFSHVVAYSTTPGEIGKKGLAPIGIEKVLAGEMSQPEIVAAMPVWRALFSMPLDPGSFQLRVLYPLRGDAFRLGRTPVLGVLELTQDITADYVQVLAFQCIIVVMCLLSSVVLFALLLLIIHRAEKTLALRMQKNRQLEKEIQSTERLVSMGRVVASIAHEIRNPLGIIRSTAELLQRRASKVQDKGTVRLLQAIYDESVRLSQTVNDFLDYARPRQPRQDPVDLGLVLSQIFAFVEGEFARAGVEIDKETSGPVWVLGDKDLLYRAFYNVLANARQALDGGGRIKVRAACDGDWAELAFTDSGKGFDLDVLPHLLEPFFTTKDGGTGLGLPIVKSIIESHGGSIALANAPEGGACVTVRLPLAREVMKEALKAGAGAGEEGTGASAEPVLLAEPAAPPAEEAARNAHGAAEGAQARPSAEASRAESSAGSSAEPSAACSAGSSGAVRQTQGPDAEGA